MVDIRIISYNFFSFRLFQQNLLFIFPAIYDNMIVRVNL